PHRQPEALDQLARPFARPRVEQLRRAGVCPLRKSFARQPIREQVRDQQERLCPLQPAPRCEREQLVERVDRQELDARDRVELVLGHPADRLAHERSPAAVAIRERVRKQRAAGVEEATVDSPGVDADAAHRRANSRERRRELAEEPERVPVEPVRQADGLRGEAPYLVQVDALAVEPPDHRPTALGTQVERDMRRHLHDAPSCVSARRRSTSRARRTNDDPLGMSTLRSSSPPVTTPMARCSKFVRRSAFCSPAKTAIASTTPTIVPRPPKIEVPPRSTIVTTLSSSPRPLSCTAVESRNV